MERPVVVRAVGGQGRQAVGVLVGAHQVVARGLGGRVGRVGREGRLLGEGGILRPQRAVDLVGRDVQEPERALAVAAEARPVALRAR